MNTYSTDKGMSYEEALNKKKEVENLNKLVRAKNYEVRVVPDANGKTFHVEEVIRRKG